MGLPASKLIIATNANDILDRFFKSGGHYSKEPMHGAAAEGGLPADGAKAHSAGVQETLSPAMDILVSSNFERLLWYLAFGTANPADSVAARRKVAGETIRTWLDELKRRGGFSVGEDVLDAAVGEFESERVGDDETVTTIRRFYTASTSTTPTTVPGLNSTSNATDPPPPKTKAQNGRYVLDPHSAIGLTAALRSSARNPHAAHISLATAHPAKFSNAVDLALKDEQGYDFGQVLPQEFVGLEERERRVTDADGGMVGVREIVKAEVEAEVRGER